MQYNANNSLIDRIPNAKYDILCIVFFLCHPIITVHYHIFLRKPVRTKLINTVSTELILAESLRKESLRELLSYYVWLLERSASFVLSFTSFVDRDKAKTPFT